MVEVTREMILAALGKVRKNDNGQDVVSLGMISGVVVRDGNVGFAIEVDAAEGAAAEPLRKACKSAVEAVSGVLSVTAVLTADRPAQRSDSTPDQSAPSLTAPLPDSQGIPGIATILAVASGKGGVGKSTTAVKLAVAMSSGGARVGLLDCDVYGPSIPRLMQLSGQPGTSGDSKLLPMENYGVKCMSMGFLVEEDTPMIWRGPMVTGALEQLLNDTNWSDIDYLIIDLPPGTGDIQLTLCQKIPVSGAVIVTTPQDIALLDARKALKMFEKVDVPVLGIIENMSVHICSNCGNEDHIFGAGGGESIAQQYGIDMLGSLPLDTQIRTGMDNGKPTVALQPDSRPSHMYREIARRVGGKLALRAKDYSAKFPNIVVQNN